MSTRIRQQRISMIANSKAGENFLHVPNMVKTHSEGNRSRDKAMLHPPKAVNWSVHDTKVAYFQEARPARNVRRPKTLCDSVSAPSHLKEVYETVSLAENAPMLQICRRKCYITVRGQGSRVGP